MTTINPKDLYPWYTHDEYIEVYEKVTDELQASKLYKAAYQQRIVCSKVQYSLDFEDEFEYSAWSESGDSSFCYLAPQSRRATSCATLRYEIGELPGRILQNICRNLQPALYCPFPLPLLQQFLYITLLPGVFQ